MIKKIDEHEFAFFIESLSVVVKSCDNEFFLTNEAIAHRLKSVIRLSIGQECVFFDRHISMRVAIVEFIGKKQLRCHILTIDFPKISSTEITFLLPLLKRDDYLQAIYALTEIGVTTIQLMATKKSRSLTSITDHELDRSHRIIIAAAEQSKNFAFPILKKPLVFEEAIAIDAHRKFFFDPQGQNMFFVIQQLKTQADINHIILCVGPEGDLSSEEKSLLCKEKFTFCALTSTILRAVQAATISAGIMRSII